MNGLQQMVHTRGGLEKLPTRLRKTLSMYVSTQVMKNSYNGDNSNFFIRIDLFHSTTWDCSPRFPFIRLEEDFSASLKALSSLSEDDLQLLKAYEKSYSKWSMHEMLQVLRVLTAVRFSDPLAVFNRLALSDAIYLLEHQLLSPQLCLELEQANFGGLKEAFRLAVFLYIDKVLREMPPLNIKGLVSRLISAVKSMFNCRQAEISLRPHLGVILWILMIGRINAHDLDDMQYFMEVLFDVYRYPKFKQRIDFQRYLDEVGPVLQPFKEQCEEILTQIERLRLIE